LAAIIDLTQVRTACGSGRVLALRNADFGLRIKQHDGVFQSAFRNPQSAFCLPATAGGLTSIKTEPHEYHASEMLCADNFCDDLAVLCDEAWRTHDEAAKLYKHFTGNRFFARERSKETLMRALTKSCRFMQAFVFALITPRSPVTPKLSPLVTKMYLPFKALRIM
jgi:hypothetical protein